MTDGRRAITTEGASILPLFAHADRLRGRDQAAGRRVRRRWIAVTASLGLASIGTTLVLHPLPRLVCNASASAPLGLYSVMPGSPIERGDMVVAWAPPAARALAAARNYLPVDVPLVKRVRAIQGDQVCAIGAALSVNGRHVGTRERHDRAGRPLPWWHGCITLRDGMFLLLNDAPGSFDGRYFGATRAADIIGRARPLWLR